MTYQISMRFTCPDGVWRKHWVTSNIARATDRYYKLVSGGQTPPGDARYWALHDVTWYPRYREGIDKPWTTVPRSFAKYSDAVIAARAAAQRAGIPRTVTHSAGNAGYVMCSADLIACNAPDGYTGPLGGSATPPKPTTDHVEPAPVVDTPADIAALAATLAGPDPFELAEPPHVHEMASIQHPGAVAVGQGNHHTRIEVCECGAMRPVDVEPATDGNGRWKITGVLAWRMPNQED